ncbi:MAG: hypothetical protein MPW15_04185 [Candidatus Manganitrophus sp.]|nr:hypothetical protein [Candidatus Manganitrophus sp.]
MISFFLKIDLLKIDDPVFPSLAAAQSDVKSRQPISKRLAFLILERSKG